METKEKNPLRRIWELAAPYHGRLKYSIFLSLIGVICGFIPYYCAAKIITLLVTGIASMQACLPYLLGAAAGSIAKTLLTVYSTAVSHTATFASLADIRKRCVKKLSSLSMGTLQDQSAGRWKTILVDQIESMEKTLAHLLPEMTGNIIGFVVLLIALFFVNWRMALLSLLTIPIGFVFMISTMKSYSKNYSQSVKVGKEMNDAVVEYIGGVKVLKAFNQSDQSYARYADSINDNASFYYNWMKESQVGVASYSIICPAVLISIIPFGLLFFLSGSLTAAEFLTVVVLSMSLVTPIMKSMEYVDSLAMTGTVIKSVETILDAPEQHHPLTPVQLTDRSIEMKGVHFTYTKTNGEVLKGISLNIKPNTKTALVGPSGGGKSTIAKLISGFWDADSGSVSIGGVDIKDVPLTQISDNISYVSQDNFLFDDTIRNNIRMGREDATDAEVEQIAKAAGCHDFIIKLEHGYETNVGGGGTHLSRGERQRITIARAMLKNAPIVILDEATAYIDPENEAILQKAIGKLVKDKTLIVIAHRLSTVTGADQIVVVEHGEINSIGTHESLLETSNLYRRMWESHIDAKEGELV